MYLLKDNMRYCVLEDVVVGGGGWTCNLRCSASGSHLHRQKFEATSVSVFVHTRVDLPRKEFRRMQVLKGIWLLGKRSLPRLHCNNVHCII